MTFFRRILDNPRYGYLRDGEFYKPTQSEIFSEFFSRLNVFRSRKNWLPFFTWVANLSFGIPMAIYLANHFSFGLTLAGFFYGMVVMGSHGTFWLHRFGTHRAFSFRNRFWTFVCRNLVIKTIPEETYIISHHVHHQYSEEPGDPYNVHAGWLYCFLADVNHQSINKNLSKADYNHVCQLLKHTGMRVNSYSQYLKWGSVCHPLATIGYFALNWAFWYAVFFAFGGHALATALFGWAGVWAFGVRTFNYEGHGRGKDLRREGIDFNRRDLSVNRVWPGYVAGEWHNNHHLYPNSATCGFLPYQLDLPWYLIRTLAALGIVRKYSDAKPLFFRDHYYPYKHQSVSPEKSTAPSSGVKAPEVTEVV